MDAILYYDGESIGFIEGFDMDEIRRNVALKYSRPVVAVNSGASRKVIEEARQQSIILAAAHKAGVKAVPVPPPAVAAASALSQELAERITKLEEENRSLVGICHMVDRDIELVGEVSAKTVDAARVAILGTAVVPYLSPDEIAAAAFSQFGIVAEDSELVAFAEWILKNNSCAGAA